MGVRLRDVGGHSLSKQILSVNGMCPTIFIPTFVARKSSFCVTI